MDGLVFFGCGQLDKGLYLFEKAIKTTPHDTDLRITKNLMAAYLATDQFDKAIAHGEKMNVRQDGLSFILTAHAYAKNGDKKKAQELISQQKKFEKFMDTDRFNREFATFTDKEFVEEFYKDLIDLGMD